MLSDTATACIGCLTNWVSMTELIINCTVEGFGPQPRQINIYFSIYIYEQKSTHVEGLIFMVVLSHNI